MAKILLVEDDKNLREIYGVRLLAEGYDIVTAGDGEEALAMAIKERPQLIVADVMMPKISGFDMLDILRSTTETKGIKIIIMTALSSEEQRARGESLGADKYLVKSQVGIEDVIRAVHEVLGDTILPKAPSVTASAQATPAPQSPGVQVSPAPSQPQQSTSPAQSVPISAPPSPVAPSPSPSSPASVSAPAPNVSAAQTASAPAPASSPTQAPIPIQTTPVQPVGGTQITAKTMLPSSPPPASDTLNIAHGEGSERVINPLPPSNDPQDIAKRIAQELSSEPPVQPMSTQSVPPTNPSDPTII